MSVAPTTTVLDRADIGAWWWDRAVDSVRCDHGLEALFGLSPGAFPATFEGWLELVHPDDRAAVTEVLTARRELPTDSGVDLRMEYRCLWPDGSAHWLESRGALQVDVDGDVTSGSGITLDIDWRYGTDRHESAHLVSDRAARDIAESAWRRLGRLQDVAMALAAASTVDEVAEVLIDQGLAALHAGGGFFSTVDLDREEIVLRTSRSVPRWVVDRYHTVPLGSDTPPGRVVRSGRPVFVTSEEDRRAQFPDLEWEGAAAFAVAPVLVGDRVTAVLAFGFAESRMFHAEDRELIATIVGMSADALKRAELSDATRRAAVRSTQLERVAARLVGARTASHVGEILIEELMGMVGASTASLYLYDETDRALKAVVLHGYPDEMVDAYQVLPISDRTPATAAFASAEPVLVASVAAWRSRYPDLEPFVAASGIDAVHQLPLIAGDAVIGTLGFGFRGSTHLDDDVRRHLGIIAAICAQALARAVALQDAQRATARLASIDEITDAALSQLALDDLLEELPRRVAAAIGCDTVRIMLLDDDGVTLQDCGRYGLDGPSTDVPVGRGLAGRVAETGTPLVFDDVSHEEVIRPSLPPSISNVAGIPLISGGDVIGVLDVGAGPERPFTAGDIELLGLAGDRIATAIERSRAFEIERSARQHADFMGRLGETVSRGGSMAAVAKGAARLCAGELADWCVVTVVSNSGSAIHAVAHSDPALQGILQELADATPFDASSSSGEGAVVMSGAIEMTSPTDADTAADAHPRVQYLAERLGAAWQLTVPLVGTSRIVGALKLARTDGAFSPRDVTLVRDLADRVGVAIENRLSHERHRQAAITLQRSLMPGALPEVPGAEISTGYWPASDDYEIGGDFFDVVDIGPGRWGVLIGDISGKGIQAAAMTGIARQTARAAARHGLEPDQVLHWIHDAFFTQQEATGSHCSAVYGVLDVTEEGIRYTFAVGGHPLPVVRPAGGAARYVGLPGTVLGLIDPIAVTTSEVVLSAGDWLVLYTDGVTDVPIPEAIDDDELLGLIDRACEDSPEAALVSLEEMLKERYGDVPNRDDTALVIVRCRAPMYLSSAGSLGEER